MISNDTSCLAAEYDEYECCSYPSTSLPDNNIVHTGTIEKIVSLSTRLCVRKRYDSYISYCETYSSLLYEETEENKKRKENQIFDSVVVTWNIENCIAEFSLPDIAQVIRFGESIVISDEGESINLRIIEAPKAPGDKIRAEFDREDLTLATNLPGYTIQMVFDETTYIRCKRAIDQFYAMYKSEEPNLEQEGEYENIPLRSSVSRQVRDTLLGVKMPSQPGSCNIDPHKFGPLNDSQAESVKMAFQHCVSLIKGPPGTGKTTTATCIVQSAVAQGLRVLVCAPSNTATNNLLEKISSRIPNLIVRLCSQPNEYNSSTLVQFFLQSRLLEAENVAMCSHDYLFMKSQLNLSKQHREQLRLLQRQYEISVLRRYAVVFSTCCGAGDSRLKSLEFDLILIDEATQDHEPSCLIPIMKGSANAKIILIGDDKQLGPVILSETATKGGFDCSLFERLVQINVPLTLLNVQYRMHPGLSTISNKYFYNNQIQDGVSEQMRQHPELKSYWPKSCYPTAFCAITGPELFKERSICNEIEVQVICDIVADLIKRNVKPNEIAIIASYTAQIKLLQKELKGIVQVATINGYQGKEKNFIILSLVRSNRHGSIGFMENLKRLNVGMTRAKFGLFLVGNPLTFLNKPIWHEIIKSYCNEGLMLDGFSNKPFNFPTSQHSITNQNLKSVEKTDDVLIKDEFVSRFMGHINIHNEFIGAIIGLNGDVINNLMKECNTEIYVEPDNVRKTDFVSVTVTTKIDNINEIILKIKHLVKTERSARLGREARFEPGFICRNFHPRPTSAEVDSVLKIVQSQPTFIEFSIRHDVAGTILGRRADLDQYLKEKFLCTLVVGGKREERCVLVYANKGCKSLKDVPDILKHKVMKELDSYRPNRT